MMLSRIESTHICTGVACLERWLMTQAQEATYQEYQIVSSSVRRGVGAFDCCPDPQGWPYVEFAMTLVRAEKTYNIKIIMLNIVLTYLSFGVFLLDPKTGERLQFSTTVLLTIVAADSLVTGVVPVCRPVLWIEYFFLVCWVFCVASIVGNMVSRTGLDPVSSAP